MQYWNVEQSHLIEHPETVGPCSAEEAVRWIKHRAAQPRKFDHQRPFGPLDYEVLENGTLIKAYFRDKNGDRKRFMRLRRL